METESGGKSKPVWAIAHEQYNPEIHVITEHMLEHIKNNKLRIYPESAQIRFIAVEVIIEMIEKSRTDIFGVPEELEVEAPETEQSEGMETKDDQVENGEPESEESTELTEAEIEEAVARAEAAEKLKEMVYEGLIYVDSLSFSQQGGELKDLAAEVTPTLPGIYQAFSDAYDAALINSDTRRLGEGIIGFLIVNEGGLGNRLPEPAK